MQQRQDDLKRLRTSGPTGDNLDGSRRCITAEGDDPVGRFIAQKRDMARAEQELRRLEPLYRDLTARRAAQAVTDDGFHEEILSITADTWAESESFVALVARFECTPEGGRGPRHPRALEEETCGEALGRDDGTLTR